MYTKRTFCQDRLGTNIGKPQKQTTVFSQRLRATQEQRQQAEAEEEAEDSRLLADESRAHLLGQARGLLAERRHPPQSLLQRGVQQADAYGYLLRSTLGPVRTGGVKTAETSAVRVS